MRPARNARAPHGKITHFRADCSAEGVSRTGEPLSPEESDRVSRVAKLLRRAVDVFGDKVQGKAMVYTSRSVSLAYLEVIVPEDTNVLVNPGHEDARAIRARVERQLLYDPRVLRL